MDNLHFLRFYYDREFFRHTIIPLRLAGHSRFHDTIPGTKLARFNENEIFDLLPRGMTEGIDRFSLFDFSAPQNTLWDAFAKINDFYYDHAYTYTIRHEEGGIIYKEFFDGEPVLELVLGDIASADPSGGERAHPRPSRPSVSHQGTAPGRRTRRPSVRPSTASRQDTLSTSTKPTHRSSQPSTPASESR
jgi:hypothetical protein